MNALPSIPEMHRAWSRRDGGYDGLFYFGVRTTGIFCRPSCSAKKPLARNVEYFASVREASFAGYRPCKRCHPLEAGGQAPAWVQRLLARIESDPESRVRNAQLRRFGIDPARARRHFIKHYGMTFQAYARARRLGRAFEQIKQGIAMDEVAMGQGYESQSGFREAFAKAFGAAPGSAKDADCVRVTWLDSPIGPLVAAANSRAVVLLEFTERRMLEAQFETLRRRLKAPIIPGENEHLARLKRELAEYFAGKRRDFSVPLNYPGTEFQQKVWNALLEIPYGETCSYEDIARRVGSAAAVRAVGTTNGLNRICIVIPCHRVVNKGGKLGGYGGGLWRKQALLSLEQGQLPLQEKVAG
ncbi:MAG TPA: methylated-DNA--[protein]-cysteine S-methyltransferase [Verrucomicrobiae bacterium]|nr:methylated-DNA--[protein]-cysteine S-methyltransferase [Verrucomicrobiae bacterium]